ncbi:MAG: type II toxin-antitoxin system Phd/YefM family antitoxin [Christensenella sp.]|nr:type II toxin-antitoxin system Phd/YefM family antitoxin [Christensenella sp.]
MIEISYKEFSENLNEYSDKVLINGDAITIHKNGRKMVLVEEPEYKTLCEALAVTINAFTK